MDVGLRLGSWTVVGLVGAGTFGRVSLLTEDATGRCVAVKTCAWPKEAVAAKLRSRWTREVEAMALAAHENLVATLPAPFDLRPAHNPSGLPALCTEYCAGGDLRATLDRPENANGFYESEVRCLLADLAAAVRYVHSLGLAHRDVNPRGVVLSPAAEPARPSRRFVYKLTDLGVAKDAAFDSICGRLDYYAPELFYAKTCAESADYWSLGLVAFEAACGARPFLPHMPPVRWMQHVKTKTHEQICAVEDFDGRVEFSTEMFAENRLSKTFKGLVEAWLRLALEWDPKKRGRSSGKSVSFDAPIAETKDVPEIFTALDRILAKKIMVLFSVPTYEYLSYEIDGETTMETLQGRIERDTKINVNEHLFISGSNYSIVNTDGLAVDYWTDETPIMLFFYKKTSTAVRGVKTKISPKIRPCLENPKMHLDHRHSLDVAAYSYFYVSSERELYESYIRAAIVRLEYVKSLLQTLHADQNKLDRETSKLIEKNGLLDEFVAIDAKHLTKFGDFAEISAWTAHARAAQRDVVKLRDALDQFSTRLVSVARRYGELQSKELYNQQNDAELYELNRSAVALVARLRAAPEAERVDRRPCTEAAKIVYRGLKVRDRLLANVDEQRATQTIADVHTEAQKMVALVRAFERNVESLSGDLTRLLVERQNVSWRLLLSSSSGRREADFKIGEPVRSRVPLASDDKLLELQALINENVKLRQDSIDFISRSHKTHATLKEELSHDFDFLNE